MNLPEIRQVFLWSKDYNLKQNELSPSLLFICLVFPEINFRFVLFISAVTCGELFILLIFNLMNHCE